MKEKARRYGNWQCCKSVQTSRPIYYGNIYYGNIRNEDRAEKFIHKVLQWKPYNVQNHSLNAKWPHEDKVQALVHQVLVNTCTC